MPRGRSARRRVNPSTMRGRSSSRSTSQRLQDASNQPIPTTPDTGVSSRGRKRGRHYRDLTLDEDDDLLSSRSADVWVLVDSIPCWAGIRAKDTGKANLHLSGKVIAWWAIRGLYWSSFRHNVETQVLFSPPSEIIVIHLGGNDLTPKSIFEIKNIVFREVKYLRTAFPYTTCIIIWVDILQDGYGLEPLMAGLHWKINVKELTAGEGTSSVHQAGMT